MPATVDERPRLAPEHGASTEIQPSRRFTRSAVLIRARRAIRVGTIARLIIVAAAIAWSLWAVDRWGRHYTFLDMRIYHGAMVYWTHGGDLYTFIASGTTLGFTYPPFAALVMAPIALFSTVAAGWINLIISLAALVIILSWLLFPIADRYRVPRWFVVAVTTPLFAATEPVRETLGFGQVNLLLALLVFADFVALRRRARISADRLVAATSHGTASSHSTTAHGAASHRPATNTTSILGTPSASAASNGRRVGSGLLGSVVAGAWGLTRRLWCSGAWAGAGVGLATSIKLTPGLFIAYFVITRQWRAVLVSVGTAIGTTVLTIAFAGRDAISYFTSVLPDTGRVGEVDATANQSLAGLLARLYDSPTTPTLMWLAFGALMLAVGMIRSCAAHNDGDELTAFTLVGLTANVICPISWSHHLVFLVPALVVLVDAALRRRRAARGLASRGMWTWGPTGVPALAGLRQLVAALGIFWLFVVSPIWRFEHKWPMVSHYRDGLHGVLAENSLALAIIALVVLLPWRPGADPAFYSESSWLQRRRSTIRAQHIRPAKTGTAKTGASKADAIKVGTIKVNTTKADATKAGVTKADATRG